MDLCPQLLSNPATWEVIIPNTGIAPFTRQTRMLDLIPNPDALWGIYIGNRDMTADNRPTLKLRQAGNPLFYLVDDKGQLIYFGSTVMFRLVYDKRPIDLIPPALRNPAVIDFAEALFGYVRSDEELNALKPRPKQGEKGRAYTRHVLHDQCRTESGPIRHLVAGR